MGVIKKTFKFSLGGVLGAGLGVVGGLFLAPGSGAETQRKVRERIRAAKVAGVEAQASKERELIDRYRNEINDRQALSGAETASKEKLAAQLDAINAPQLTT
jgi:gas vesicle protein